MKTKITLQENIAAFACLFILFVFNNRAYAQIIYTDIPDATPNATYPLDLNNDSIVDFMIQFSGSASNVGVLCYPQNNNAYSGNVVGGEYLPWALSANNLICDTLATWYDANKPGTMAWGTSTGYWVGESNKYLALKLVVGSNTYYGWARFDVIATSTSFTLKDYAYESTPNTCILSGKTSVGIKEHSTKNVFSVFPNPFISTTTIETNRLLKNATLTIYNSYGQTLKQVNTISGLTLTLSRDNLPSGLYFMRLTEENTILAEEKLIIID